MAFWVLMGLFIVLGITSFVIGVANEGTTDNNDDLELWMAPGSGRLFLYNPKTRMMENDELGKAEVSGNTDQWVLEKIGKFN